MADQSLPIPTGGDPASTLVDVTPPGDNTAAAGIEEPAQPSGTPLDNVHTLIENIGRQTALADILTEYITERFKAGVDFGSGRGQAGDKPTLLKPGGEKLISILGLRVRFVPDRSALAMAGNPAGLFAYKCLLINWHGETVGEGRGACSTGERKNMTINNAIKIAEKRAQIDAICRVACVSERFTDDDVPDVEARQEQRQEQRQERRPVEQRQDPHQLRQPPEPNQGAQINTDQIGTYKQGVWAYFKGARRAHNQTLDDNSIIADINDYLRETIRLGCTVGTATPAEWARAYTAIRKLPLPGGAGAASTETPGAVSQVDYEEIFN